MVAVGHHLAGFEGLCTETLGYGSENWPISTGSTPKPIQNGNATAVAKDLVKELTPEEKTTVAGLSQNYRMVDSSYAELFFFTVCG
ncbi:P44-36 outer membrane domain protein [Anaplasma phagocytophilum str. ApMUC09]|uniref:p44-36 outer membrane domain protein n=1 Tax=Anaplasma phagocytophilum str. ApMUC09 TaxID=1359152 RepID=A0A0F3NA98_ANAPH|nr:P44-36 outer membrane domain protein [Anaplasma phagocytophilum str. ApMUC09]SCV62618.1 hypothetical protein ANAPH2_00367 [Anaplasma phagocytophilum]